MLIKCSNRMLILLSLWFQTVKSCILTTGLCFCLLIQFSEWLLLVWQDHLGQECFRHRCQTSGCPSQRCLLAPNTHNYSDYKIWIGSFDSCTKFLVSPLKLSFRVEEILWGSSYKGFGNEQVPSELTTLYFHIEMSKYFHKEELNGEAAYLSSLSFFTLKEGEDCTAAGGDWKWCSTCAGARWFGSQQNAGGGSSTVHPRLWSSWA